MADKQQVFNIILGILNLKKLHVYNTNPNNFKIEVDGRERNAVSSALKDCGFRWKLHRHIGAMVYAKDNISVSLGLDLDKELVVLTVW